MRTIRFKREENESEGIFDALKERRQRLPKILRFEKSRLPSALPGDMSSYAVNSEMMCMNFELACRFWSCRSIKLCIIRSVVWLRESRRLPQITAIDGMNFESDHSLFPEINCHLCSNRQSLRRTGPESTEQIGRMIGIPSLHT
jgi:hypothetical protein